MKIADTQEHGNSGSDDPSRLNQPSTSGWEVTATEASDTPPVQADQRANVLVVGAGYTGLNAAIRLAEAGKFVVVADAKFPGYGASGRNGGQVIPGLKYDPDALIEKLGTRVGEALVQLSGRAADATFELIRKHRIECHAQQSGWLQPAISERTLAQVKQRAEQWRRHSGIEARVLSAVETSELVGADGYVGGWVDPRGGTVQPLSYARGLASVAQKLGVCVAGQSAVVALRPREGGWEADVNGCALSLDQVIVATNGYSENLIPLLDRSIVTATSVQVATAPLSDENRNGVLPGGFPVSDTYRILKYMRFDPAGRFLIGGRGTFGTGEPARHFRSLRALALRMFPQLSGVPWDLHWSGKFALTVDGLPHVHQPARGLFAGLGFNGRGVAMSTQMGRLLADLVLSGDGKSSAFPITTIRPIPLHRFRAVGAEALGTWYRILDRLEI